MSQTRHAYLILAHTNPGQLATLLTLLDDKHNDIFLHIDQNFRAYDTSILQAAVRLGTLHISSTRHLSWGSEALIDGMLDLLAEAAKTPHAYYHLISGMDLPLKPQAEIHAFFEANAGAEFVDFREPAISQALLTDRLQTYHFFQSMRDKYPVLRPVDKALLKMQHVLGINRLKKVDITFQKGSQWFSVTHAFAQYCVANAAQFRPYFRFSKCGDELFFQTILQNSPFLSNRFFSGYNDNRATMRYIDWDRGNGSSPYVFTSADFEQVMRSGMLFARKFDETVDAQIISQIAASLGGSQS